MSPYKPSFKGPYTLVRARATDLTLTVWDEGSKVTLSDVTVTVYDHNNAKVVDAGVATVTDFVATYEVAADKVPVTLDLSTDWLVEWSTNVGTYRNPCILAYRDAQPVVSVQDMTDRHSLFSTQLPKGRTSWSWVVDRAWEQVDRMLLQKGRRSHLVLSSYDLYDVHLALSLSIGFTELETYSTGKGKYAELAKQYRDDFDSTWAALKFTEYDQDEDGDTDGEETGSGMVSFTSGPTRRRW